eukprot:scaffold7480_cov430-Prasinococcus_capsulatus_cf.AAC.3
MQIGKEKSECLMAPVVEHAGPPKRMFSNAAAIKVPTLASIKQEHVETERVGGVHELLQVIRASRTMRNREEIGDLVAKGRIQRMLLDAHELDSIVAALLDLR